MKANTETLRHQNRALLLSTVRSAGQLAHTDIAAASGLGSSTVSAITAEFEQERVLLRLEQQAACGRGRPRVLFGLNPECAYLVAARITAEKIEYSLLDYCGTLKDRFEEKRIVDDQRVDVFVESFKAGLDKLVLRSKLDKNRIHTVSITTTGLVARGRALLLWSAVFDDQSIDFQTCLQPEWNARVLLTNETCFTAQAMAEKARQQTPDFLPQRYAALSLGHSIGLGVAKREENGRISSFAPPFGHMVHLPDGPLCRCGGRGCIESFAGFYAILRAAFEVPADTIPAKFIPLREIDSIAERARKGDRRAAYAFRVAGDVIGVGISRLHSFLGPMPLLITGPGVRYVDLLQEGLEKHIRSNLQVRYGQMPQISFATDEGNLIFQGNAQVTLSDLDENLIAPRKHEFAEQSA